MRDIPAPLPLSAPVNGTVAPLATATRGEVIGGCAGLQRTYDAALVNSFANHPDIRPELAGSGPLDLAPAMRGANVYLFGEHGGLVFSWSAPRTYETHVVITKAGRGRWGFDAAREAVGAMIAAGAEHLWCRVHPDRLDVALFALKTGYRECGTDVLDLGEGPVAWRLFEWRLECRSR